ncbi:MAG: hypothetical protein HRU03_01660 [Nanoarchaeales archaeon]|nr:hypothetical protein [Nanoarchaeales archaeon]
MNKNYIFPAFVLLAIVGSSIFYLSKDNSNDNIYNVVKDNISNINFPDVTPQANINKLKEGESINNKLFDPYILDFNYKAPVKVYFYESFNITAKVKFDTTLNLNELVRVYIEEKKTGFKEYKDIMPSQLNDEVDAIFFFKYLKEDDFKKSEFVIWIERKGNILFKDYFIIEPDKTFIYHDKKPNVFIEHQFIESKFIENKIIADKYFIIIENTNLNLKNINLKYNISVYENDILLLNRFAGLDDEGHFSKISNYYKELDIMDLNKLKSFTFEVLDRETGFSLFGRLSINATIKEKKVFTIG